MIVQAATIPPFILGRACSHLTAGGTRKTIMITIIIELFSALITTSSESSCRLVLPTDSIPHYIVVNTSTLRSYLRFTIKNIASIMLLLPIALETPSQPARMLLTSVRRVSSIIWTWLRSFSSSPGAANQFLPQRQIGTHQEHIVAVGVCDCRFGGWWQVALLR